MAGKATTSRFKQLPRAHREIAYRLVYLRKCQDMPQSTLAAELNITVAQLANIESARVPIRLLVAWNLCRALDIHPSWLCTGLQMRPFPQLDAGTSKWIESVVATYARKLFREAWIPIAWLFQDDPDVEKCRNVAVADGVIPNLKDAPENFTKDLILTDAAISRSNITVTPQLPKLLARLKMATQARGKKAELAEFLQRATKQNVPLASISRWLAGDREPGGEITLLLLRWVELQEK